MNEIIKAENKQNLPLESNCLESMMSGKFKEEEFMIFNIFFLKRRNIEEIVGVYVLRNKATYVNAPEDTVLLVELEEMERIHLIFLLVQHYYCQASV